MKVSVWLYWEVPLENATSEEQKCFILECLTKASVNNIDKTYNLTFDYMVEVLHRFFKVSRRQAYLKLSESFPRDYLPRSIPTKNGLNKRAHNIPKEDMKDFDEVDLTSTNYLVITGAFEDLPHIDFSDAPPSNNGSFYVHELIWTNKNITTRSKIESVNKNQALKFFYYSNINTISELKELSFLAHKKVTLELLSRLMSPFWQYANDLTTLEEQKNLINQTLKREQLMSRDPLKWQFDQQEPYSRIEKHNTARIIKIHLTKKIVYALYVKHHLEGIYILLLNKAIEVAETRNDPNDKNNTIQVYSSEYSLDNWLESINNAETKIRIKYHYFPIKSKPLNYPSCKVTVYFSSSVDQGMRRYNLQQTNSIPNNCTGKANYGSFDRELLTDLSLESAEVAVYPSYYTSYLIPFERSQIQLNLQHLSIEEKHIETILHQWAAALDTTKRHNYLAPRIDTSSLYKEPTKSKSNNKKAGSSVKTENEKPQLRYSYDDLLKGKTLGENL
ncbi:hypothetical protein AN214_01229 [Pseudoalteromonas sp. P1-9]|uniref:hypothetical protein n=1 Tax=Pseudoalteromonas sp. P1-9 TaxID=1710354 RepID=UPI0006D5FA86|nr:hypothetical protein [Pseudoalteromonas sp. P1-9]KPV96768.1 hypothetical protein AN214_01229 [Pseudoalteromonas sp. P1-9]